ncbi:MAG TPA: hypothetical protein PLI77_06860 [Bacteroidales bacterium]|nr:hypothetical protein [Bacteroidales bacterium]
MYKNVYLKQQKDARILIFACSGSLKTTNVLLLFFFKLVKTNCEKLVKLNLLITKKLFTIHYKTEGFDRVRDLKGAEGGAEWSEAEWSTGAKRTPEKPDGEGGIAGRESRNAQINKLIR